MWCFVHYSTNSLILYGEKGPGRINYPFSPFIFFSSLFFRNLFYLFVDATCLSHKRRRLRDVVLTSLANATPGYTWIITFGHWGSSAADPGRLCFVANSHGSSDKILSSHLLTVFGTLITFGHWGSYAADQRCANFSALTPRVGYRSMTIIPNHFDYLLPPDLPTRSSARYYSIKPAIIVM